MLVVNTIVFQVSIIAMARSVKVLSFEKVKFREDKSKRSFFSLADISQKVFDSKVWLLRKRTRAGDANRFHPLLFPCGCSGRPQCGLCYFRSAGEQSSHRQETVKVINDPKIKICHFDQTQSHSLSKHFSPSCSVLYLAISSAGAIWKEPGWNSVV